MTAALRLSLTPGVYWLTRDQHGSTLSPNVDVWRVRPNMRRAPRIELAMWYPSGPDWFEGMTDDLDPSDPDTATMLEKRAQDLGAAIDAQLVCAVGLADARDYFGTVPDTWRECVRVEIGAKR